MGRERQKHKNRSSRSKVVRRPKSKKRILNNPIIAANWDKSQTLAQNYRRLGLTARLNKETGGVQKTVKDIELRDEGEDGRKEDGLKIPGGSSRKAEKIEVREGRIERDPNTGRILKVLDVEGGRANPLNDPLQSLDSDSEVEMFDQHGSDTTLPDPQNPTLESKTAVVRKLEQEAQRPEKKYKRKQSQGERIFVEALVKKYGDDYGRMARDTEINYMQRSTGDLKRRVAKWREASGGSAG